MTEKRDFYIQLDGSTGKLTILIDKKELKITFSCSNQILPINYENSYKKSELIQLSNYFSKFNSINEIFRNITILALSKNLLSLFKSSTNLLYLFNLFVNFSMFLFEFNIWFWETWSVSKFFTFSFKEFIWDDILAIISYKFFTNDSVEIFNKGRLNVISNWSSYLSSIGSGIKFKIILFVEFSLTFDKEYFSSDIKIEMFLNISFMLLNLEK